MKYKIDKEQRPVYLQIYKQIKADIIGGIYAYGSKLPSKRLLSEETETSTVTVEHAYLLLCDEGYVEARERSGYFVIFRKSDGFAASAERGSMGKRVIVGAHDTPEFSFSVLCRTMRAVQSDYQEEILERSPNEGRLELREALLRYLARNRGISVALEQIVIGSGAEYLYGMIIKLLGRERIYAIEAPSYQKIEQVYRAEAVQVEALPLTQEGIDSEALLASRAEVLHTTPYRSYPTGVTATASKRHEYLRWAGEGERFIIEDDFESEFSVSTKPEDTLFSLSEQDNVIYLNSFSKTISPALRVGYMVLPLRLVGLFHERLGFYSCTVPTYEQLVLASLIESGNFERHINRVRRNKRRAMQ